MILGKKTLFSLLLGFDLLANVLELAHVNILYTTTLVSCFTTILLPGILLSLILQIKRLSFWENLSIIVGLGIVFLECGGLLLNIVLPLIGVKNPLAFQNILISFNLYYLYLFTFAWIRTKPFAIQLLWDSHLLIVKYVATKSSLPNRPAKPSLIDVHNGELTDREMISSLQTPHPKYARTEKVFYILPVFFPLLATMGAIVLNNGGSNILALTLLGVIALYNLLLILSHGKLPGNLYPYALFFTGAATLLATSLRSWYISGHDIAREFYVFQLTNTHHIWSMGSYQDPYNACLSLTILPTILTNLLAIQDIYVYKVIFQILFAFSPVIAFFILQNYTTPILAFISTLFFISFPTFFNDMPMLCRQEIGYIFFGLVLYMTLLSHLPLVIRKILFVIFAFGIILSHYSTNFVLLSLISFVYIFTLFISRPFVKNTLAFLLSKARITPKNTFPNKAFLSLPLVLLLLCMTYVWNTLYTHTSDHTVYVVTEVVRGFFLPQDPNQKTSDLAYSLFSPPIKQDPKQQLENHIQDTKQSRQLLNGKTSQFYTKSITDKYPVYSLPQERLAPTPLGNLLSSLHIPVFNIQAGLRSLSASFMQISVFVGLLALLFLKNKKSFDLQYFLLCLGSLVLLGTITLLPILAAEYGVLRMFQQFLFILSLPIVLSLYSVLFFAKEQKRILFTGIIAILFFLNLTGFISHLTGDYYPQYSLDNAGLYYNAYYVHKSNVLAMVWLSKNDVSDGPVEADLSGANKLLTYGHLTAQNEIFPAVVLQNSYVYLEVSTYMEVSIDKNILIYSSSKPFLDDNKNLIYSNSSTNVYR
jgi:uncharacterized membrane protein